MLKEVPSISCVAFGYAIGGAQSKIELSFTQDACGLGGQKTSLTESYVYPGPAPLPLKGVPPFKC